MELEAKEILSQAVNSDRTSRFMEAECLYREGTDILIKWVEEEEVNFDTKRTLYNRIAQYLDRAKQIRTYLKSHLRNRERILKFNLPDNTTGKSYEALLSEYLNQNVKELVIEEPLLQDERQLDSLISFLETLIRSCPNLKFIRLITKPAPGKENAQIDILEAIKLQLYENHKMILHYILDAALQAPRLLLNNGFIILIQRGLHIYKVPQFQFALGLSDLNLRECLPTDVEVWSIKPY